MYSTLKIFIVLVLLAVPVQNIFSQKTTYNRIISLSPLLTEEIFLLGRDSSLIADTTYCIHPEAARQKPKIGNLMDFSVEKIISMRPDLILASGLTDPAKLEKFRTLKIRVETFLQPAGFKEICSEYIRLGKLLDKEETAKTTVNAAGQQTERLRIQASRFQKKKVFIEIGTEPLFSISRDSFINDFIMLANGTNIVENSGNGMVGLEAVLDKNPDVIIISDMGTDPVQEIKKWGKYGSLSAVRNKAIFSIDSYALCSPTPQSFVPTLKKIISMIHPEFREKNEK